MHGQSRIKNQGCFFVLRHNKSKRDKSIFLCCLLSLWRNAKRNYETLSLIPNKNRLSFFKTAGREKIGKIPNETKDTLGYTTCFVLLMSSVSPDYFLLKYFFFALKLSRTLHGNIDVTLPCKTLFFHWKFRECGAVKTRREIQILIFQKK